MEDLATTLATAFAAFAASILNRRAIRRELREELRPWTERIERIERRIESERPPIVMAVQRR